MHIAVSINSSSVIIDTVDGVPVLPLACDIHCTGRITAGERHEIDIEDPEASQKIVVYCASDDNHETMYLLHPSSVDAQGEVTCLPVRTVSLKPEDTLNTDFSLYAAIMDKCFSPGTYRVSLAYDSLRSEPCVFNVRFSRESVPELLKIVDDASVDLWVRKEALRYLNMVNASFKYDFSGSPSNEKMIAVMRQWWDLRRDSDSVITLFERINTSNKFQ